MRGKRIFSSLNSYNSKRHQSSVVSSSLGRVYDTKNEENLYEKWVKDGQFTPELVGKRVSSILLPPPNITGTLHLGHSLTVTCQDVIARWNRMSGHEVLWVPGTDHAGIATQVVVEKMLATSGISRTDLNKNEFLEKIWTWKNKNVNVIVNQLKRLGASVDWSRMFFTMGQSESEVVTHAFVKLWQEGLIYQGDCLVNWCSSLGSAISDIEVDHVSLTEPTQMKIPGYKDPITFGNIIDFAYKFDNPDDGEIVVSTTRLETMLGDECVCVHPEDSRYFHLVGKRLKHPFTNKRIKIIADPDVDPQFGTGAMKVTPAHDQTDFEIAQRHKIGFTCVIDEEGNMNANAGPFKGIKRFEARVKIFERLNELGLIRGVKPHPMQIPVCSRTGDIIEFLPKPQWFLRCSEMAKNVSNAVHNGELSIEPVHFEKDWFRWLENIRDWCISRQLWWGHQLPLYKVDDTWVACESEEILRSQQHLDPKATLLRHPDVLDTWFSSALLPLTVAGWPKKLSNEIYPLEVMITGHDILFFWVARMAMFGLHFTGQLPFKKVFLHGIVCDSEGRKMSKSVGNVINPQHIINGISKEECIEEIEGNHRAGLLSSSETKRSKNNVNQIYPNGIPECGSDALRFTLLSHKLKNHYINFDAKDCLTNKLFCNKIWQASRFTLTWADKLLDTLDLTDTPKPQSLMDKWILLRLSNAVDSVNHGLASFDFHIATSSLKHYIYSDICDTYLESIKPTFQSGDKEAAKSSCYVLLFCLVKSIQMLAPVMPFLSEKLFCSLQPHVDKSIHTTSFPQSNYGFLENIDKIEIDRSVSICLELLNEIRSLKSTLKSKDTFEVSLLAENVNLTDEMIALLNTLSRSQVSLGTDLKDNKDWIMKSLIRGDIQVYLKREGISEEIKEPEKKRLKLEESLNKLLSMRRHNSYKVKVSESVQRQHSEKIAKICAELNISNPEDLEVDEKKQAKR